MFLKKKAIAGVKWTGLSSALVALFQITQIAILTRYLVPEDFGLMAIVSVVIGFSGLFMDMGISSAIIHKQNITKIQLSSLYWLNVFSGLALYVLIYIFAPAVAAFYSENEIAPLLKIIAVTFFISSLGNQFRILDQKNLQFDRLAKVEMFSASISLLVAVLCAANNFGVYSLVYAALARVTVTNIIFVKIGLQKNKPSLTYKHSEIKSLIGFGLFQMGERSVNYFNSQIDVILIGKLLGADTLGIYSVSKAMVMKPARIINPIITRVTFPVMAKVQNNTDQLKNIFLKTIYFLCSVNFPIYIVITVLAEPLVFFLFGNKWSDSVLIIQILAIYFMLRSIGNPVGSLLLAKGRVDLGFYWNLCLFLVIPLFVYMGSFWGLTGVVVSMLLLQLFLIIPSWYLLIKPLCQADIKDYFFQIYQPLLISVISFIGSYLICYHAQINSFEIKNILFIFIGGSFWMLLQKIMKTPLRDVHQLLFKK